eukprot:TRINITY_DN18170_c0_g1_i1.p1 TRINITY_DN18170_c0_g1~~TRINITY_DN18170_c0_g1_i1.p1  ORF type:complete len:186 (+),score=58.78 TRINITY_DN18170_c0_g1_i1:71-559(+)
MGDKGDCMHRVDAIIALSNDGDRLFAQYYPDTKLGQDLSRQQAFEKTLYEKTHPKKGVEQQPEGGNIAIIASQCVVYWLDANTYYYVIGGVHENEVILSEVLQCLVSRLTDLMPSSSYDGIDKRVFLTNFDKMCLLVDDMIDDGIIMNTTPQELPILARQHL